MKYSLYNIYVLIKVYKKQFMYANNLILSFVSYRELKSKLTFKN